MKVIKLNGVPTTVSDNSAYKEFWNHVDACEWEITTLSAIDSLLPSGGVYIDVGAWIGPTVLVGARKARKVVAYEPDPVAAAELHRNISLNELKNVEVREVALFDRDGVMSFGGGKAELGESSSSLTYGPHSISVQVKDAAQEVNTVEFQNCSLLKIDVEGAEYRLLPRMRPFLQRNKPALLLSVHPFYFSRGNIFKVRFISGVLRRLLHIYDRAMLFWLLRSYRHIYRDERTAWADAGAHWKKLSFLGRLGSILRYSHADEFLFVNEPYI
jgi:FkbM family methyltransferase